MECDIRAQPAATGFNFTTAMHDETVRRVGSVSAMGVNWSRAKGSNGYHEQQSSKA